MPVVRKCDSHQGFVKGIRRVCQLMERYNGYGGGGCKGIWKGVITFRRCDSPQGGVKDVRKVYQLMERCNAHVRSVQELGEV